MYFIIGDVHGCLPELEALLQEAGDRQIVFVGDLTDRGPNSVGVLRLVRELLASGRALAVRGNHDDKLARLLRGRDVKVGHGMETTVAELGDVSQDEKASFAAMLEALPHKLTLDEGRLVVVHAAAPQNLAPKKELAAALFGVTTGETDADGLPVRVDWAAEYAGAATVVHGHVRVPEVTVKNRVWNLDTGCAFGGALSGLLYPEMEVKQVNKF